MVDEGAAEQAFGARHMKLRCNTCFVPTRHSVTHEETFTLTEETTGYEFSWLQTFYICQCLGCESVTVISSLVGDGHNGEPYEQYFPPRSRRKHPAWLDHIPGRFSGDAKHVLLKQIYATIDTDALHLAALGIRALIEHIMIEQVGDGEGVRTFKEKIEALHQNGHISKHQSEALSAIVEFGNAVTHRSYSPSEDQVMTSMDAVEGMMQSIYVHNYRVSASLKGVPSREPAKKPET